MKALSCPSGHSIPHKTPSGECTPMYCAIGMKAVVKAADKAAAKAGKALVRNERKAATAAAKSDFEVKREQAILEAKEKLELQIAATPDVLPAGASSMLVAEGKLEVLAGASIGLGKHRARHAFIKDLPGEDADEVTINNWTDKRTVQLLPLAVAEKEYQLRFGDDAQRERAADAVLRMTGRYQKEGAISGGASIILNIGGEGMQLPFMPRRTVVAGPQPQLVDGKVLKGDDE